MNKTNLKKHLQAWIVRLGSQAKVAEKCNISDTALSQYLNGKYGANTDELDRKIASALSYRETDWQTVEGISNFQTIKYMFDSCKDASMWMAVSNRAGSGKTRTLEYLFNQDVSGSVFLIQAEEWNARQFLVKLAEKTCGVPTKGYVSIGMLLDKISDFFNGMQFDRPLLVIDEADKLKPAALRQLIPLYNRTQERLGCLLAGTENLKKEIRSGVRCNRKGYDEIDSRLGRTYVELKGANKSDVKLICTANGLDELQAARIWNEIEKVKRPAKVRTASGLIDKMVEYTDDLRRLNRLVMREKIANRLNA